MVKMTFRENILIFRINNIQNKQNCEEESVELPSDCLEYSFPETIMDDVISSSVLSPQFMEVTRNCSVKYQK